jgi:hypothetical protein
MADDGKTPGADQTSPSGQATPIPLTVGLVKVPRLASHPLDPFPGFSASPRAMAPLCVLILSSSRVSLGRVPAMSHFTFFFHCLMHPNPVYSGKPRERHGARGPWGPPGGGSWSGILFDSRGACRLDLGDGPIGSYQPRANHAGGSDADRGGLLACGVPRGR